jgi:phage I-like protein
MPAADLIARCTVLLPEGATPPEWVKLMPAGAVEAVDGRKWTVDPATVVAASKAGVDLVVDYEHQTDHAERNGQPAPAAGWVKELEARPDGIWGRVAWTAKAAAHLAAREYRYLSPTFMHTKAGAVTRILRAALTNAPAIHDLPALAREETTEKDPPMEKLLKALCKLLGLPEDTAEDKALAALSDRLAQADTAEQALAKAKKDIGAKEGEDLSVALARTAQALGTPDPAKYVPADQVAALARELNALKAGVAGDKATARVEQAVKDGQLPPSLKDWGLALAKSDLAAFDAYLASAPKLAGPGQAAAATPPGGASPLTEEDKAVCRQMGHDEEAFLKAKEDK